MFNTLLATHLAYTEGQISQEVYDHAKEDATFLLADNLKPHLLDVLKLAPAAMAEGMFGYQIASESAQLSKANQLN